MSNENITAASEIATAWLVAGEHARFWAGRTVDGDVGFISYAAPKADQFPRLTFTEYSCTTAAEAAAKDERIASLEKELAEARAVLAKAAPVVPQAAQALAGGRSWTLLLTGENNGIVGHAGNDFNGHPEYYERITVVPAPAPAAPQATSDARDAARHAYLREGPDAALATLGAGKGGAAQEGE